MREPPMTPTRGEGVSCDDNGCVTASREWRLGPPGAAARGWRMNCERAALIVTNKHRRTAAPRRDPTPTTASAGALALRRGRTGGRPTAVKPRGYSTVPGKGDRRGWRDRDSTVLGAAQAVARAVDATTGGCGPASGGVRSRYLNAGSVAGSGRQLEAPR